jgi:hypothetical protein
LKLAVTEDCATAGISRFMDNAPAQMHAHVKDQRKLLLVAVAGVEQRRSNYFAGMIGTSN